VYKHGKTIRRAKMSLVFADNTRGFTRVAVVVSKKVLKTAVGRNRIRRRMYEAIRVNFDRLPKKKDYIFVIYDKDIARMPFGELEEVVSRLMYEVKVCYNGKNE